jgi:AraC-like DNA-binding protein
MTAETLTIYETGDLERPVIPSRSRLYALKPIGLGTPEVESLTSYLTRLANAHRVAMIKLAKSEFAPILNKPVKTIAGKFYRETHNLNGINAWTRLTIDVLERLTFRDDVCFLTMYPWRHGLSYHKLLRHHLAWCPKCYQEWQPSEQSIYNPLLWALDVVQICPRHRQVLCQRCPYADCHKRLPLVNNQVKLGYCPHCGRWLGIGSQNAEEDIWDDSEWKWQVWLTHQLGAVLAAAPDLATPSQPRMIAQNIRAWVEAAAPKSAGGLALEVGISPTALYHWMRGRHLPRLDLLAKFCYYLDIRLLDILAPQPATEACPGETRFERDDGDDQARDSQPHRARRKIEPNQLGRQLERLLNDDQLPPCSVDQVARRLGVSTGSLAHHYPDQYRQIVEGYEQYCQTRRSQRNEKLERDLRAFLESDEMPPPSMKEVARRLKIHSATARQAWPELCRLISRKRAAFYETRNLKAEVGLKEILAAHEDPPPSISQVAARLGESTTYLYRQFPDLCRAVTRRLRDHAKSKDGKQPGKQTGSRPSRTENYRRMCRQFAAILAAEEKPPPSVTEVARRLECSPRYLRRHHPDLHAQLRQQAQAYRQAQKSGMDCKLRAILAQDEIPPPSLREVASQLGCGLGALKEQCPEWCEEITHRYRSYRNAERQRRKAFLDKILAENPIPPPSLSQVARSLNCRGSVLRRQFLEESRAIVQRRQAYLEEERQMLQEALEGVLADSHHPLPSLMEVARQLGYEDSKYLRQLFPELCHQVFQRHLESRWQIARSELEAALADDTEEPPTTLEAISRRLGYNCTNLKHLFPDQCRAILERQRAYWQGRKLAVEQALKAVLADEDSPPVSVQAIAQEFGFGPDTIRDCFPELTATLSQKYKAYIKERGQRRRQQLDEEVKRITRELYRQGIHPGLRRVSLQLPSPKAVIAPHVQQAWREALAELGL